MPIVAIVDEKTGQVQGAIVADPNDPPYPGTRFVLIEEDEEKGAPVDSRFDFDDKAGAFVLNETREQEHAERILADRARVEAEQAEVELKQREKEEERRAIAELIEEARASEAVTS